MEIDNERKTIENIRKIVLIWYDKMNITD